MSPAAAATHSLRSKVHWPDMEHTPQSHTAVSRFLKNLQETCGQLDCRNETKSNLVSTHAGRLQPRSGPRTQ